MRYCTRSPGCTLPYGHDPPCNDLVTEDICANNHRGNPHSEEAHASIVPTKEDDFRKILHCIDLRWPDGMISEEVEHDMGRKHQTISARISELHRDGSLTEIGQRLTSSGRPAGVYVLTYRGMPCQCKYLQCRLRLP